MLTPLQRDRLYDLIRDRALCCSVAQASVEEIDTLNILHATMLAMKRAIEGLRLKPAKVLVDGNRLPIVDVLAEAVIGGDATVKAISAASILAKVHRDRLCQTLHEEFPQYGFAAAQGVRHAGAPGRAAHPWGLPSSPQVLQSGRRDARLG